MSYTEASVPDQSGKTVFITGANSGIGHEAARVLTARSARVLTARSARVLLGCRSEEKAQAAMAKIRAIHPQADLEWVLINLASLASVKKAADQVTSRIFRVSVLPSTSFYSAKHAAKISKNRRWFASLSLNKSSPTINPFSGLSFKGVRAL